MWIARLLPEGTKRYKSAAKTFQAFDGLMDYKPLEWFALWVMYGAGVGWRKAVADRYYFWEFSGWPLEVAVALILTVIVAWAFKTRKLVSVENNTEDPGLSLSMYFVLGLILFLIGWAGNPVDGLKIGVPYFLALIGAYVMFLIPLEKEGDVYRITDHKKRILYSAVSLILSLAAVIIGYFQDEPVISTSAMVFLPFVAVSLLASHARHVRRARLYSVFIYGFFVSMRAPWLLVMMFIHYHGLRFYNYFRHGIVSPTLIIEAKEDIS